jgi:hypothetical protein
MAGPELRALRASVVGICAKRTQMASGLRAEDAGRGGRRRPNAQNEPNFARPQAADGGNCAKRSQTWGSSGIWGTVGVWLRAGSECAKQSQTWVSWDLWGTVGVWFTVGSECAKRSQFDYGARDWARQGRVSGLKAALSCKTKPIGLGASASGVGVASSPAPRSAAARRVGQKKVSSLVGVTVSHDNAGTWSNFGHIRLKWQRGGTTQDPPPHADRTRLSVLGEFG